MSAPVKLTPAGGSVGGTIGFALQYEIKRVA